MKTYQQLWQSITPLYEAGEAQAIVRTVLDVKYGMTLTDIICGKVNELSADEERKLLTFDTLTFAVLNITTKYKCIFEK